MLLFASGVTHAGELKVDINRDSKNLDQYTEIGYTKWSADTTGGSTTGTAAATKVFTSATGETVTIGFSQTALSASRGGTGLLSNLYQTGATNGARLVSDGFTVAPATLATGGQIQMTITGLSAGHHTLLTYHNHWDALVAGTLGPIDISVNGVPVVDNLQPTIRAATNTAAPIAYLEFDVADTSSITTILFSAETITAPSVTIKNPVINGFEIDTPNSTRTANTPSPADGDEHVNADGGNTTLGWATATAGNAVSHDVYFGTSLTSVRIATPASAEFKGNQTGLAYPVAIADSKLTYYWRVDEIDPLGNATKGTVWYFRPRHLAFPGAEGYGRFARGGRGGVVVEVTNLNDSGPGSLRDALTGNHGPRTVVFTVSGLITLASDLTISQPYITLAGQTAPGKGVCVRNYPLGMSGGKDVIIRNVRSRPGNTAGVTLNGSGMAGCDHCIMDHCSISWGIDEEMSTRSSRNVTLQRTLISEALNIAGHKNYPAGTAHGYAASIGGDVGSFHHNLLAHNEGRNWSMAGGLDAAGFFAGRLDIFNNVVYNWGHRTTDGGAHEVNFVNNYYKPGAATSYFYALNANYGNFPGTQQYYVSGNVMPGYFNESNQTAGRTATTENGGSLPTTYSPWVSSPFFPSYATVHSAGDAFKIVLSDVGCNQPMIDDHDVRVIRETRDGTYTYTGTGPYGGFPGLPNSQGDVGGWENYLPQSRAAAWDSDHDGLPDWWEELFALNPNSTVGDFSESNADPDNDGYTMLEAYLNWMAEPHAFTAPGVPVRIDLAPYTAGFGSSVSTISNATGGGAALSADGHTVVFTPSGGLGGFDFTVTGGGTTVSRRMGICISSNAGVSARSWRGGLSGNAWNNTASNWINGSALAGFQTGNAVTFDDTGAANPNVTLQGTLQPSSMRVAGSARYTFSGGQLVANSLAVESGGSMQLIDTAFSVNGDLTNQGTIRFTGSSTLQVGGTFTNNGVIDFLGYSGSIPPNIVNGPGGVIVDSSSLRITQAMKAGAAFQVTMPTYPGHTYQLQRSATPGGTWQDVAGQSKAGDGTIWTSADSAPFSPGSFLRIRVTTP